MVAFAKATTFSRRKDLATSKNQGKQQVAKQVAKQAQQNAADRPICENRKARHDYEVIETLECGLVLQGSEVKSLRGNQVTLDEAYGRVIKSELWLVGCDIPEYKQATHFNHAPKRQRKLLMHRGELRKFAAKALEKGLTLVPLKLYFKGGRVKVLLAVCRGKQQHDKRQALKKAEAKRSIDRAMRRG